MLDRNPGPAPDAERVRVVAGFYGALVVLAFFWHALAQDSNDLWHLAPGQPWHASAWGLLLGAAFGQAVVVLFRRLEPHARWLPELHREFRAIFGRPGARELFVLAAASALGEELLFRGAMMDAWGLGLSSLVFAALHVPPRPRLWPWTASAFVLGLALGALTLWTGNLAAAVAAHFVINLRNMRYVTHQEPEPA